jgi:hypothetical protein
VLTVVKKPLPEKAASRIPYQGDDEKLRELLKPTPLLEVDDPAIRRQARENRPRGRRRAGRGPGDRQVGERQPEKETADLDDRAKEVLMVRQGDCNEHAALFAALGARPVCPRRCTWAWCIIKAPSIITPGTACTSANGFSLDATFGQFPAPTRRILRIVSAG